MNTALRLVELLWDLSLRLSDSPLVLQLLGIDYGLVRKEAIHALLFQFQLTFLVFHEYTHHVHRHCDEYEGGLVGAWTEFQTEANRAIEHQAQELDADSYAIYLVLTNFLRGGGRQGGLMLRLGILLAVNWLKCASNYVGPIVMVQDGHLRNSSSGYFSVEPATCFPCSNIRRGRVPCFAEQSMIFWCGC